MQREAPKAILITHSKDLGRFKHKYSHIPVFRRAQCVKKGPVLRVLYSRLILQGRPRKQVWGEIMMGEQVRSRRKYVLFDSGYQRHLLYKTQHQIHMNYKESSLSYPLGHLYY